MHATSREAGRAISPLDACADFFTRTLHVDTRSDRDAHLRVRQHRTVQRHAIALHRVHRIDDMAAVERALPALPFDDRVAHIAVRAIGDIHKRPARNQRTLRIARCR